MTTIIPIILLILVIAIGVGIKTGMTKRMLVMLAGVVVVLTLVFGWKAYSGYAMYKAMMSNVPSPTVSAIKASIQDWQPELDAVANVRAAKGADLSNELPGIVEEIHFNSGADVKEGDLLLMLRAKDDIARQSSLEAAAKLAQINYDRDKKQLAVQAISQATVDNDMANLQSARAQLAEQKAIVEKKSIHAPFSGHLGIRNVDVGQYLNAGTNIVTLQDLDSVYLDFYLPQQDLSQVQVGQTVVAHSDTWPTRTFEGKISAINPKVDTATRNVQVRAELANSDHALLPGMYATITIHAGTTKRALTLPQTAITYNPYGNTVFLLTEKGENDAKHWEAKQSFVTLGETRGDQVQVVKGVAEGDMVVTSGQIKLQNGVTVKIDNSVAPTDNPHPEPKDE